MASSDNDEEIAQFVNLRLAVGESFESVAKDLGMSNGTLYRVMDRAGYRTGGKRRKSFHSLRKAVESMLPIDAVDYLMNYIEGLLGFDVGDEVVARGYGFTNAQARIVMHLSTRNGVVVSRERLNMVATMRPEQDLSETNSVSVFVHHIKKRFSELNWDVDIRPEYGIGYALFRGDGFLFPWEKDAEK